MTQTTVLHSLVIPVFNERAGLGALYGRLRTLAGSLAPEQVEFVLVNDGSRDGSDQLLDEVAQQDPRFKVIHLSRNFGHQVAITAGMQWASGQTVTVMDADLQDPPEVVCDLIATWRKGYEVVYAVRRRREGETPFKRWTAALFYRLLRRLTEVDLPVDTGDFRLLDRVAVDALLRLPERHRFVRGMVSWVGFRQIGVPYDRAPRLVGETHYPLRKMLKLAFDGITSFSSAPLQIATSLGMFAALLAMGLALWALYLKLFTHATIQGWTSTLLVILFLGSGQLLGLGIIGQYLGRIYDEVKARPLYFVARTSGFPARRGEGPP